MILNTKNILLLFLKKTNLLFLRRKKINTKIKDNTKNMYEINSNSNHPAYLIIIGMIIYDFNLKKCRNRVALAIFPST